MEVYDMKTLETNILELSDNIDQSELSSQAINRYIEISTHYINMEKVQKARKLLCFKVLVLTNLNCFKTRKHMGHEDETYSFKFDFNIF